MKVGIITQPLYVNYGGILQNYALQQVLKKMGHEPVTLDFMPSLSFGHYLLYAGKALVCYLSPEKRHPIKPYKHFLERPSNIDSFVRNNIEVTKTVSAYTRRLLRKNGIEAVIVGSDQVWRYSYNHHWLEDMFLGFVKNSDCRKIAYAASFGVEKWDYPQDRTAVVRKLIKSFDAVSVRENSAVSLCKDCLGVDAQVVFDPTLLLSARDYDSISDDNLSGNGPYLAAYVLDKDSRKNSYIHALARAKGLEVKEMTVSGSGCSIEEWVSTIRNAEIVVTDSYHGTLFSILFQKQFLSFINRKRGADRFHTLLDNLGLQDRLIDIADPLPMVEKDIDYPSVLSQLDSLRDKSFSFLESALS